MDEERCVPPASQRADEGAATAPEITPYKPDAKTPLSKKSFWRVLLSIELCMLAVAIDIYSIPVAVPALSSDKLGYLNSAWLGTSFLVSFALGYLIWPRLFKGFSYKISLAVAIEAYNLAATVAPSASKKTAGYLIAVRAISGAGAGGTYGLFEMILSDIVPPKDFKNYMCVSGMVWGVAAVIGQVVSGALVDYNQGPLSYDLGNFSGKIGYIMAVVFLNIPGPSWADFRLSFRQFDYLGSVCLTVGTFCMLLVSASGGTILSGISGHPVGLISAGLALLAAFCFIEPSVPDPLLRIALFRDPALLMTAFVAFFYAANLYGTLYYVPHFFQLVLEDSALISSVNILPMIVAMVMGIAGAFFANSRHQTSPVNIARGGAALAALASGLMVRWITSTSRGETVVVLGTLGLGQGAAFIGLLRSAKDFVGKSAAGNVPRLFTFFLALGSAFGVACFAALYMNRLESSLCSLVPDVAQTLADMGNAEDEHVASLKPHVRDAYESGMQAGWWVTFGCALAVLFLSLFMKRSYKGEGQDRSNFEGAEKVSDGGAEKVSEAEQGS